MFGWLKRRQLQLKFDITQEISDRLDHVADLAGLTSHAAVARKAFALYDYLVEHWRNGGKVILRAKDGSEIDLIGEIPESNIYQLSLIKGGSNQP